MADRGLRVNVHVPQHIPDTGVDERLFAPQRSQFARGLRAGTAGLKAGVARAGEAAGLDTAQYAEAQEQIAGEEVSKARVSQIEGIDDLTDFTDWAAFKLGEIAPSIVASIGGGGVGGLAGRAVAGGVKNAAKAELATKVGVATGVFGASATPQAGQVFQEIREESGIEAPGTAFAAGAVGGLLDVAPQLRLFNRVLRPGTRGPVGREIITQTGLEAGTEASQEAIALGARALEDPTFDPLAEPNLDQTISRLLNAGATGALGGSLGGAVAEISALRSHPQDARTGRPGVLPTPGGAALSTSFEDLSEMGSPEDEIVETQDLGDRIDTLNEASRPGSDAGLFDMLNSTEFFKGAALSPDAREAMGLALLTPENDSLRQKLGQMNEQWFRDNPDEVVDPDIQPYRIVTALDQAEDEAMRAFPYDANLRRRYIDDFAQGVLDDKEGVTTQRKYAQARQDYARARERGEPQETLQAIAEEGAKYADQLERIQPVEYRNLGDREGQFDSRQFLRNFETIAGATTQRPDVDLTFDRLPTQKPRSGNTDPAHWVSWKAKKDQALKEGEFAFQDGRSKRIVNLPNAIAQVRAQGFKPATRAEGREATLVERVADEMATAVTLLNEKGWLPGITSRQELVDLVGPETVVAFAGPKRTQPITLQQVLDQGFSSQRSQFPERTLTEFDPTEIETLQGEGLESMPELIEPATPPEQDTRGVFTGTEPARPRFEPSRQGQLDTRVAANELEGRLEGARSIRELQQIERDFSISGRSEEAFGQLGEPETPPIQARPPEEQVKTLKAGLKRMRKNRPDAEVTARNPDAMRSWQEITANLERRLTQAEREVRIAKQIRRRLKAEVKRLRDPKRRSRTAGQSVQPVPPIPGSQQEIPRVPAETSPVVPIPERPVVQNEDRPASTVRGPNYPQISAEDRAKVNRAAKNAADNAEGIITEQPVSAEKDLRTRLPPPLSQLLNSRYPMTEEQKEAQMGVFVQMAREVGLWEEVENGKVVFFGADMIPDYLEMREKLGVPDKGILSGDTLGMHSIVPMKDGTVISTIFVRPDLRREDFLRTLGHELGHTLYARRFASQPDWVKKQIFNEYNEWLKQYGKDDAKVLEVIKSKTGDGSVEAAIFSGSSDAIVGKLDPEYKEYLLDFDEWWADRVANWLADTSRKPNNVVDRFFKSIADALKRLFGRFLPQDSVEAFVREGKYAPITKEENATFFKERPTEQPSRIDPELQRLREEDEAMAQGSGWTEDGERRIEAAQRAIRDMRQNKEEAIRLNRVATPISQEMLEVGFQQLGNRGLEDFVGMRDTLGLAAEDVQFITARGTENFIDFVGQDLQRPDISRGIERGNTQGLTIQGIDNTTGKTTVYVWVRPDLDADLFLQVLAHEMGHALYMTRASQIPTNVAGAMMDEYQTWLGTYHRPGIGALELVRSKKGDAAAILALVSDDRISYANIELQEMSEALQEYHLSFDEWWADRVSEWMRRPASEAKTAVEKFFAALADAIRRLFNRYPSDRTVDDYLASLSGGKQKWTVPASALDLSKAAQPDWRLPTNIRSGVAKLSRGVFDDDPDDVAGMAWLDSNGTLNGTMYSTWVGDVWDALTPEMRSILGRTALSAPIQSQLRRLLANSEEALAQIREPKVASAYAYMFWRAGQLNIQGDMQNGFTSIRDTFFDIVRYITNEDGELPNPLDVEESARVFDAIRQNRMRVDPTDGRFEPVHRTQDGPLPVLDRWSGAFEKIADVGSSLFSTLDSRLRGTENPALIQLASMFAKGTGRITTEPGFWQSRNIAIGNFTNTAKGIFEGLTLEKSSEFLDYVYGAENFNDAPTEWQGKIVELRKLMRQMLKYQRDAGIEIRDLGENYFPWVMDLEQMESGREGFFRTVNQKKYQGARTNIAETINKRRLNAQAEAAEVKTPKINKWARQRAEGKFVKFPEWVNPSELIDHLGVASYVYDGALSSQGYADVEVDLENDAPSMRFMNTRILNFVDPAEMRPYLSDDAAQTLLSYIYQAVKHSEYSRRFGEDNAKLEQLLEEAREFGATDDELKLATDAVHANMGTYGIERALWLNKHLGLALPRPRAPINDTLNRSMGAMLVFQNLKYLGLATITSLVDPLGISVRSNSINMAVKSMYRSVVDTAKAEPTQLTDLAEMLGLIEHTALSEALSWRFEGQYMQGMSKKINETWFKVIGLDQLTRMTRLAATSAAQSFLRKHVTDPNQHSERYLQELNLQAGDVQFNEDGTVFILNQQQRDQADSEALARDNRVRQAIVQFVDESILRPNPMQRTLWGSDPHFMLFQHLKSFMYSFYTTILKRVGVELSNHNFYSLMTIGMYIPAMIAATAIRDLIRYGEDGNPFKADWTLWNYMEDGAMRAGLYGYMGTLGADVMQDVDYGGYGLGGMFSTLTSTITDIDDVLLLEGDALIGQLPGSVIYNNWVM